MKLSPKRIEGLEARGSVAVKVTERYRTDVFEYLTPAQAPSTGPLALDFTRDLGILCALVCFVLSSISMGIPTNGGLGAWHIAVIFGLSLYGVGKFSFNSPDPEASAFAMLVWGAQTLLLVALGIYTYLYILFDKSGKTQKPSPANNESQN